ncbi:hemerythrin domain-containing protein [Roseivivax sp. CAU 1761]
MDDTLKLDRRDGLPEALRLLAAEFPRPDWQGHDRFGGLVQFWMERHGMFRQICAALDEDVQARLSGRLSPEAQAARLGRYGSLLVNELHNHHRIEDMHYFPALSGLEPRLDCGFALLDADHHAMDGLLDAFAQSANGVIDGSAEPGRFHDDLTRFAALLERHLTDEEDLVVPVILKHGDAALG